MRVENIIYNISSVVKIQKSERETYGRTGGEGEYRMTKRNRREGVTKTEAKSIAKNPPKFFKNYNFPTRGSKLRK